MIRKLWSAILSFLIIFMIELYVSGFPSLFIFFILLSFSQLELRIL